MEVPFIFLTEIEQQLCYWVGEARQADNEAKGRKDAHGFRGNGLQTHVDGARTECAAAKIMNRYWEPVIDVDDLKEIEDDVTGFQVRGTKHLTGSLILHKTDPDDKAFVLVIDAGEGKFLFPGWMYAKHGKLEENWQTFTGRPCYFVKRYSSPEWKDINTLARYLR